MSTGVPQLHRTGRRSLFADKSRFPIVRRDLGLFIVQVSARLPPGHLGTLQTAWLQSASSRQGADWPPAPSRQGSCAGCIPFIQGVVIVLPGILHYNRAYCAPLFADKSVVQRAAGRG